MSLSTDSNDFWPSAQTVAEALGHARGSGSQWYACCPTHDDQHASLSIGTAESGQLLVNCHAGCPREDVIAALKGRNLWRSSVAYFTPQPVQPATPREPVVAQLKPRVERTIVATYDYCDEHGELLYQKLRYAPKGFAQRVKTPDGWAYKLGDVRRVLYRLPAIVAAPGRAVFVVEGEKDADALTALGRIATCNDSGAGKWADDLSLALAGRMVIVVADNDDPGLAHAEMVANKVARVATKVLTVTFTDAPEHADMSDWLATHDIKQLLLACTEASKHGKSRADGIAVAVLGDAPVTAPAQQAPAPEPEPERDNVQSITDEGIDSEPKKYSEDAFAKKFITTRLSGLRFCHDYLQWLIWNGSVWSIDKSATISDRVRVFCRDQSSDVAADLSVQPKTRDAIRMKLGSLQMHRNIEGMARTDPTIGVRNTQLDQDRLIIGTPAGAWNLKSRALTPMSQDLLITKTTRYSVGAQPSEVWMNFVHWLTRGDSELDAFLQRMAGYCLTGSIDEHALFFLFGPGGNGKSVFLNMLSYVFGDYATNANMETFMESASERHTTELARLQGARLVTALESDADKKWAEGKIKALTGGDRVTARYMRKDNFEYDPQFKIVLAGNHMPKLLHVDAAMRRRLHLIPFMARVDVGQTDPALPAKLREHGPGILRWCVDGAQAWLEQGLNPPHAVRNATDLYFEEEDVVYAFLRAKLIPTPGSSIPSKLVYDAYCRFTKERGERPTSAKDFNRALSRHDVIITSDARGLSTIIGFNLDLTDPDVYSTQFD